MQEKENVMRILKETKKALKMKDVIKLKELSNQTIHTASIAQDPDNITIAVIVYALSKIIERGKHQLDGKLTNFIDQINFLMEGLEKALEKEDKILTNKKLQGMRAEIDKLSGKLKRYIQDVFRKGSINKASKIYEHGISMEKTASLLGITMYELASYAGSRDIETPIGKGMEVKKRIKIAMDFFK
jgi:hypothetical protein